MCIVLETCAVVALTVKILPRMDVESTHPSEVNSTFKVSIALDGLLGYSTYYDSLIFIRSTITSQYPNDLTQKKPLLF